ncbi:esterase/lipase family protein [Nocardia stercoris]|uniref:Lipase n=1 Tax=Nocardia stercoris TaxID=2483361 RepID=A0A3M2KWH7_9NOCA|nr:lipase [Nocardia stercoris]RMI27855.1 lipase [Nocardia stercoris]
MFGNRSRLPLGAVGCVLAGALVFGVAQASPLVDSGSGADSAIGSAAGSHAADTVGTGPEQSAALAAFLYGVGHPDAAPPGADDWDCVPSPEHPEPVVLLHGSWMNAYESFAALAPLLRREGFCAFTFEYGIMSVPEGGGVGPVLPGRYAVGPIEDSAAQVGAFVDRVLAATGAGKVDVVAHSQGGTAADWYLKFLGGAGRVDHLVTFGATHHGTALDGIASLGRLLTDAGMDALGYSVPIAGPANIEQAIGSPFLRALNAPGDTVPGVDYTVVGSVWDEVTNPYSLTFLRPGPDATVSNITLQDGCPQDMSDHLTMMYSPRTLSIVLRTLDPGGHPDLVCAPNPWLIGAGGTGSAVGPADPASGAAATAEVAGLPGS